MRSSRITQVALRPVVGHMASHPPMVPYYMITSVAISLILCAIPDIGLYHYTSIAAGGGVQLDVRSRDSYSVTIGSAASVVSVAMASAYIWNFVPPRYPIFILLSAMGYMIFSLQWAMNVDSSFITIGKSIVYLFGFLQCFRILDSKRFFNAYLCTIAGIGGGSLLLVILSPQYSLSSGSVDVYGWRGLFYQKNGLAAFCLFTICLLSHQLATSRRSNMILAFILFFVVLMIGSLGKTEIVCLVIFILYVASVWTLQNVYRASILRANTIILILSIVLFGYILAAFYDEIIFGTINFTGRVAIWRYYISLVGQHLFTGLGGVAIDAPSVYFGALLAVGQASPHNSFLDSLINAGLIGVAFHLSFVFSCFTWFVTRKTGWQSTIASGTVLCYVVYGLTESAAGIFLSYPTAILVSLVMLTPEPPPPGSHTKPHRRTSNIGITGRVSPVTSNGTLV